MDIRPAGTVPDALITALANTNYQSSFLSHSIQ
jgi:hypothetical protein